MIGVFDPEPGHAAEDIVGQLEDYASMGRLAEARNLLRKATDLVLIAKDLDLSERLLTIRALLALRGGVQ